MRDRSRVSTRVSQWLPQGLRNPGSFTPLDLSPALWLDASDTSTITASSGAVSEWRDKSANARHFSQATDVRQPTTGSATQNGRNVISFSAPTTSTACTWLQNGTASNFTFLHDGTDHIVAIVAKVTNSQGMYYGNMQRNSGNRGALLYKNTTTINHAIQNGNSFDAPVVNAPTNSIDTNANVITVLADPDNGTAANRSAININTTSAYQNNTSTAAVSTAAPSFLFTIGAARSNSGAGDVSFGMTGFIAELVFVTGTNATEANRVRLRDYLNDKWAVY